MWLSECGVGVRYKPTLSTPSDPRIKHIVPLLRKQILVFKGSNNKKNQKKAFNLFIIILRKFTLYSRFVKINDIDLTKFDL